MVGARVTSNNPIQVQLITGNIGATYEMRWFSLYPFNQWGTSYYAPVGTTVATAPASTFLYNPGTTALTVTVQSLSGTSTISVPASTDATTHGVVRFQMPTNSGARFTAASPFFAIGAMDSEQTTGANTSVYDWGYTLVPESYLTPALKVGWAPGTGDIPISGNGSPVWVMATAATRLYIDYDGNPTTGSLTDPNGNKYDTFSDVTALQSLRIYDPDKDQTGMKVYTVDGTKITGAWGEDPTTAAAGTPYLDVGYTVLPLPTFYVRKDGTIIGGDGDGYVDSGEQIEYSILVRNDGVVPISGLKLTDPLPTGTVYVAGSTTISNVDLSGLTAIPDNGTGTPYPLDTSGTDGYTITTLAVGVAKLIKFKVTAAPGVGVTSITNTATIEGGDTPLVATNTLPVQPTVPATCGVLTFTDSSFTGDITTYLTNSTIYLKVVDSDANTNTGTAQTLTVTLTSTLTGDSETVTLTESGVNTGIFQGSIASSNTAAGASTNNNGTLYAIANSTLAASYADTTSGCGTQTDTASIPLATKPLYLSTDGTDGDTTGDLDRIDPVAT
ncbi:MAG TPA: DUF11 domain-containing protein, partial [Pirellulaceae bacterium]|nr:DUF11 domain-containing protein [Pirellulaceae bacterium]